MGSYRKKPNIIDAWQFTSEVFTMSDDELLASMPEQIRKAYLDGRIIFFKETTKSAQAERYKYRAHDADSISEWNPSVGGIQEGDYIYCIGDTIKMQARSIFEREYEAVRTLI